MVGSISFRELPIHAKIPLSLEGFKVYMGDLLWPSLPRKGASIFPPMRSFAWFEAALPTSRSTALAIPIFLYPMRSCRGLPCFPSNRHPYLLLARNGPRAIEKPSTALSVPRVTRTCARSSIRFPPSRSGRRSRASSGNSSAARRLKQ